MRASRANKSERVAKNAVPKAPKGPDPSIARAVRLRAAMRLVAGGDPSVERIVVEMLVASLAHSDKQEERAKWLGVSPRYVRYLLSAELGITTRHPEVNGRPRGFNDAGLKHARPDGSGWTDDSPRKSR